jgi:DNA polymerase-3 subunit alpha
MDRRDEVIRYVADKYGKTSVGQIATFHELKARSVIKDVARAMGFPANEAQKIASLIPAKGQGQMHTIPEALDVEPKLKALSESDPTVRELLTQAQKIEGLTRHAGMHAAGIVISEGPLWDHVPCFKNGESIVTQYYKDDVEAAGLVKFDFLGLKTLTVVDIAVRLIRARPDQKDKPADEAFDIAKIPMNDNVPDVVERFSFFSPATRRAYSSSNRTECSSCSRIFVRRASRTSLLLWRCTGPGRSAPAW